ncbi:glutamate-ammonia-ligase adenylyltransferase domain protein [Streptomyces laurentii]|uniref:Glutamate-ammonia-ligase adenylyltransferase domain protein n=1 Tax=Streptomyces laurentii TaxID=39478 RepID=A0A160NVR0_STRLU|nr:glutamate-ammonia-ligase adenylyltransferase domain protein [Streptomyces laurentii]
MQPADHRRVPLPLAAERGHRVGAQAQRAAEAAQILLALGDEVGAAQPEELDAVLHGTQEAVRLVELGGVGAAHIAAGGEGGERVEGGGAVQGGVAAAVHQLEELDGELDVAQTARAELEFAFDLAGRDVVDDPAAHLLDVGDEVLALGGLPDHRGDGVEVRGAELRVAGHRAGLQEGLELPGLGPALVVGEVGGEGADQRAVAALGAEVGVDRPDDALDRGLRADPHQVGGQPGRRLDGLSLAAVAFAGLVGGLADEDDVHVGDVVQLAAAALAHGDHGEPAPGGVLGRGGLGERERGAQGGGGEVGQFGGGLGDVGGAAHVAGGDPEQTAAVGDAQRDRVGHLGEPALELGETRVQVGRLVGDQGLPVVGVPCEVVGERLGGAEDAEQPVTERLRGEERGGERGPVGGQLGLDQADQAAQREVRVGGGAEGVEEDGVAAQGGELVEVEQPLGGGRVGEPVPQQPGERTAPASRRRHPAAPSTARSVRERA